MNDTHQPSKRDPVPLKGASPISPRYDFESVVDRRDAGSVKWQAMYRANAMVPEGISPFSVADTDMKLAPEITSGLKRYLDTAVPGYTRLPPGFSDVVCQWMLTQHRWRVHPEWLVQTNGVIPAIFHAIRAYTEPGDGIIIQTPAYRPFYLAINSTGRRLLANPLVLDDGGYRIDCAGLRQLAAMPRAKLLIFCSPHNPTGRVWTIDELRRVAHIVIENNLVLVSDEIHFDIVMKGHEHTVISTVDDGLSARTIVCTSPSKSFNLAGIPLSNIVIQDDTLRARFRSALEANGNFFVGTLAYQACQLAYTAGDAWLSQFLALINNNKKIVREMVAKLLPNVRVFDLEGTYLQWLDFRAFGLNADVLRTVNQQVAYVFFDEGPMFGERYGGFERMNIACPTKVLVAAIDRLAAAYANMTRRV